jgi:hypothetical protein
VANESQPDRSNLIIPAVVLALVLPMGAGVWWYLGRSVNAPVTPALTGEAKTYVRNLKLGKVEMKATVNYAGAAVVEVLGNITNNGGRTMNVVELNCVFYDPYGQVVLRDRVPIVKSTMKPGETRPFRLPFEGLPLSWNQAMPQLVIARIDFAE